jgi:hypothetical protein
MPAKHSYTAYKDAGFIGTILGIVTLTLSTSRHRRAFSHPPPYIKLTAQRATTETRNTPRK